jgi:hypothetical protein
VDKYARALFAIAAAFNFAMAAGLGFIRDRLFPILQLDAVTGTNRALVGVAAALIATYGYAYVCVAVDARKYRVYIPLGVIGKLIVVAVVCATWLAGIVSWHLPALAAPDAAFVLLFLTTCGARATFSSRRHPFQQWAKLD